MGLIRDFINALIPDTYNDVKEEHYENINDISLTQNTDLFLFIEGDEGSVRHYCGSKSAVRIKWVSVETDENSKPLRERIPQESEAKKYSFKSFTAAGKRYRSLDELCKVKLYETIWGFTRSNSVYRDRYGRTVIEVAENFPRFDFDDADYREHHWYYMINDNKLTRINFSDTCNYVMVTEDVCHLEKDSYLLMSNFDYSFIIKK